ncbi:MAG: flagellar basal body rod protein FlgB [Sandaracinus sp.]|nr:flagellar basal body rod protein FlgB [Sandaracinus sp.]MCB9632448.1 flagellar basal body rod protein FlgB [Sandaracinus sp.]
MSIFDAIGPGARALDYHLRRHNVLSSNVVNADTPGFRPLELVRELPGASSSLPLAATHEGHRGTQTAGEGSTDVEVERVVQPGGDGNAVSLEREMAKVAANDLRYQSLTKAIRHHLGMLRYAANDGHG